MNEQIKDLLRKECNYELSEPMLDRFIESMDEITLRPRDILVLSGEVDPDIYVVKEGILSHTYLDGFKEKTMFFSLPGTMTFASHSYYLGEPAFYQVEACCDSVILHLSKTRFDELIASSYEFCRWALSMAQCQLYYFEMKQAVINGNARERFNALIKNRPEIIGKIPLRTVASYLGITPSYLSRLKKESENKQLLGF